MQETVSKMDSSGAGLREEQVAEVISAVCSPDDYQRKKVLLIVPDGTRTAPVGVVFKTLYARLGAAAEAVDVMTALGTHHAMDERAICARLEISETERKKDYGKVRFFNHEWNNPDALKKIGRISAEEIARLTGGLFSMEVEIEINKKIFEYDQVIIIGPVFPHEVVGFSGGNKYFFPGVSGPKVLNFFHWLGAVVTNPMIIGGKWTPVRKVVDAAGAMVNVDKLCFCLVVDESKQLAGLHAGSPEAAWDAASEQSRGLHIVYKDKPFHTVLSCVPEMYDELWTGGKGMYKLEPVVADGGELIIYGPHISEVCFAHGKVLEEAGYHCRDFFLKQWDRYKNYPWGVLAHSTHVYGLGAFENGVEKPRIQVTLATGIPEETCRRINLGYRDPNTIDPKKYANREAEGVLLVPRAGEMLYQLTTPPDWARPREDSNPSS